MQKQTAIHLHIFLTNIHHYVFCLFYRILSKRLFFFLRLWLNVIFSYNFFLLTDNLSAVEQKPLPTLTPLKSESTSESSRLSSWGTFLFLSRCSSRLFWHTHTKKKNNNDRVRRQTPIEHFQNFSVFSTLAIENCIYHIHIWELLNPKVCHTPPT